jgi:hypothetical protein
MAITSAIYGHYYAQISEADSNHYNILACRHVVGMVRGLHYHSLNKWLYTSGAARENHLPDRCYTRHLTVPCVLPGTTDNEKAHLLDYDLRKIPAHLQ